MYEVLRTAKPAQVSVGSCNDFGVDRPLHFRIGGPESLSHSPGLAVVVALLTSPKLNVSLVFVTR